MPVNIGSQCSEFVVPVGSARGIIATLILPWAKVLSGAATDVHAAPQSSPPNKSAAKHVVGSVPG